MIFSHGYIVAMNEIDEPCLELNEIIYHITGEFWKQAYYCLLVKQKTYEPEPDIPAHQAVCDFFPQLTNSLVSWNIWFTRLFVS